MLGLKSGSPVIQNQKNVMSENPIRRQISEIILVSLCGLNVSSQVSYFLGICLTFSPNSTSWHIARRSVGAWRAI